MDAPAAVPAVPPAAETGQEADAWSAKHRSFSAARQGTVGDFHNHQFNDTTFVMYLLATYLKYASK